MKCTSDGMQQTIKLVIAQQSHVFYEPLWVIGCLNDS